MQLTNKHLSFIVILLVMIFITFSLGIFIKYKKNNPPLTNKKNIIKEKEIKKAEDEEKDIKEVIEKDKNLPPINAEMIYPDWNIYTNEDYRFSVQIPQDWKKEENKPKTLFTVFLKSPDCDFKTIIDKIPPDQNIPPQVSLNKGIELFISVDSLKNYGLKNYEEIISLYKNFDEIFKKPDIFSYTKINNQKALISKIYQDKHTNAGKSKVIEIITHEKRFSFQFIFDDKDKNNEKTIDLIIDSIRLY